VRAWLVGGAVRDTLLGRAVHDWDIAVERDAIPLARATANRLAADIYVLDAERDTARVLIDGMTIDFAGLRGVTLETDLAARDFTINAMAIDLDQPDRVIDLFDGAGDLAAGVVRAISESSLTSDPVRLLRAVRQAAALSIAIDPQTARWIETHAGLIEQASAERIRDELIKTLIEPGFADQVLLLEAFDLLAHVLPEVAALKGVTQSPPHHWDVFEHTRRVIDALELIGTRLLGFAQADETAIMLPVIPALAWDGLILTLSPFTDGLRQHLKQYDISAERSRWNTLKWAALLHDIAKPATRTVDESGRIRFFEHEDVGAQLAADRLASLKFSSDEIARVGGIIRAHMRPHHLAEAPLTRRAIYRYFRDCGDYGVDVLLLSLADHLATHGPEVDRQRWVDRLGLIDELLAAYFAQHAEVVAPPPVLNGDEVMQELNLKPGKLIGAVLEAVREAQAAGEVKTKAEALTLARQVTRHDLMLPHEMMPVLHLLSADQVVRETLSMDRLRDLYRARSGDPRIQIARQMMERATAEWSDAQVEDFLVNHFFDPPGSSFVRTKSSPERREILKMICGLLFNQA
jgi:putative nucleotidyltransferase with HDIG domain